MSSLYSKISGSSYVILNKSKNPAMIYMICRWLSLWLSFYHSPSSPCSRNPSYLALPPVTQLHMCFKASVIVISAVKNALPSDSCIFFPQFIQVFTQIFTFSESLSTISPSKIAALFCHHWLFLCPALVFFIALSLPEIVDKYSFACFWSVSQNRL